VDNDADNDDICDADEIAGCQDNTACNYNVLATDDDNSCLYYDAIDVCGGDCPLDSDDDGVCDDDEVAGCTDDTACNYDVLATDDDNSCLFVDGICETCSGETDGTGVVLTNDLDNDGICDSNEIAGCTDATACNYDASATDDDDSCVLLDGICDTCSEDGLSVVDNDIDDDGVCDLDEIAGCTDDTACNYDELATDDDESCILLDGICETCSEDGLSVIDNDVDDDGVCDADEIIGCLDQTACNYNPESTEEGDCVYPADNYNCDGTCIDGFTELILTYSSNGLSTLTVSTLSNNYEEVFEMEGDSSDQNCFLTSLGDECLSISIEGDLNSWDLSWIGTGGGFNLLDEEVIEEYLYVDGYYIGDGCVPGCTNPDLASYNPDANVNDGSCTETSILDTEISSWSIYPNPSSGLVNITGGFSEEVVINVFDNIGQKVLSKKSALDIRLDLSSFGKGLYFIQVDGSNVYPVVID